MTRIRVLEVLRGVFSARPMLLGAVLWLAYPHEVVAWWWTPVQAFADVFLAWLLFGWAGQARAAMVAALWGPPRVVISSSWPQGGGELR